MSKTVKCMLCGTGGKHCILDGHELPVSQEMPWAWKHKLVPFALAKRQPAQSVRDRSARDFLQFLRNALISSLEPVFGEI